MTIFAFTEAFKFSNPNKRDVEVIVEIAVESLSTNDQRNI